MTRLPRGLEWIRGDEYRFGVKPEDALFVRHWRPLRFIDGQWVDVEIARSLLASWRERGVRPETRDWVA